MVGVEDFLTELSEEFFKDTTSIYTGSESNDMRNMGEKR